ncbi:MAG: hypothetical protein WD715_11660 [Dongiaceae bacterium]
MTDVRIKRNIWKSYPPHFGYAMSIARSPKDRLRALRAGRVSQLLDPTPADGLPPTEPPRITLNGKPVATAGAFDAVLERAHGDAVTRALGPLVIKPGTKDPKMRPPVTPGGSGRSSYSEGTVRAIERLLDPTVPVLRTATTLLAVRDIAEVLARRDFTEATRNVSDEQRDPSHFYQASSNDNARKSPHGAYQSIAEGLLFKPSPFPGVLQESENQLSGPDPDDPTLRGLGKLPPFPGTEFKLPENVPEDPEQFNRPQIETIPVIEVSWRDLVLYHHSSPETEEDTRFILDLIKRLLPLYGFPVIPAADLGKRETEFYLRNLADGTRKGSAFADLAAFVELRNGELGIVTGNTVDVLKDGLTPSSRERRGINKINMLLSLLTENTSEIMPYPKSRGMVREDWERKATELVHQHLRRLQNLWGSL